MMRSASFFILSVSLHVAALFYPISFGGRSQAYPIGVTLLPTEDEGKINQLSGPSATQPAPRGAMQKSIAHALRQKKSFNDSPRQISRNETATPLTAADLGVDSSSVQGTITNTPEAPSPTQVNSQSANEIAGFGNADIAGGSGQARGSGSGALSGEGGLSITQARYRDTPRPDYPESARREGREGRVLLRVLIDQRGRSREVQINDSSGSAILDRAAAEAIKNWRFHPALYGDKPVESWLRIPIEFRLAGTRSN